MFTPDDLLHPIYPHPAYRAGFDLRLEPGETASLPVDHLGELSVDH